MKLQVTKKREAGTLSSQDCAQADHGSGEPRRCIAKRASELDVQRGCQEGPALEDWLEAEREILGRNP